MDLLGQDFSSAVLNIYQVLKETTSKEQKKSMETMPHQIKNINKETESIHILKKQTQILE